MTQNAKRDCIIPTLSIQKTEKTYMVVSESGTLYGPPVSTQEEAEDLLVSWNNYYDPKY